MASVAEVDGADNGSPSVRYSGTSPGGVAVSEEATVFPSDSGQSVGSTQSRAGDASSASEGTSTAIESTDHRSVRSTFPSESILPQDRTCARNP
ncbi:hypothetical protein DENSPDRAFT_79212 [Dentipellis sp. KUC8613]|nr:hypothetical protein DENSPDRAFT_79212 [Dentipellis sp. KUC8613]